MDKKKLEELSADHESWDSHVGTPEDTQFVSDEEDKAIDDAAGLQAISIRLSKNLIEQLKGLAKLEGLGYQPLIRQVLTKYAQDNEHKLDMLLSASDALERADRLFAQAIKLKDEIPKLAALSNERIFAESDYTTALGKAQTLFAQAFETGSPVAKQHASLRMSQIGELCQYQLQADYDNKYGKRQAG